MASKKYVTKKALNVELAEKMDAYLDGGKSQQDDNLADLIEFFDHWRAIVPEPFEDSRHGR